MAIIRNNILVIGGGGGVKWNITYSATAPVASGNAGDIVVVPTGELPETPLDIVEVHGNLDESDGNIYTNNAVHLFVCTNSTIGTAKAKLISSEKFVLDVALSNAVVNVDGGQIQCTVYVWDTETSAWVGLEWIKLNPAFKELINLAQFVTGGIDIDSISVFGEFGLIEALITKDGADEALSEQIDVIAFVSSGIDTTNLSVFGNFNLEEVGTYSQNDDSHPIE